MRAALRPAGKAAGTRACRLGRGLRSLLACSAVFFSLPQGAWAQDSDTPRLPRNNVGTVGLIDMPSARMAPDGEFASSFAFTKSIQRYNMAFQVLPWLEGTFRYSGLEHFDPDYPVYWDRSFGLKARLLQESDLLPDISFGINDIIGTGIYSAEYLVASKQIGPFDATVGMGWGRYGTANTFKNPIANAFPSFEFRRTSLTLAGGTNFNIFFHGPTAGLFGGLVWHTPLDGLSIIAEASSDDYDYERNTGTYRPHTQMNYGVSYRVTDSATVGVNWLYGRSLGVNLSFALDPTTDAFPQHIGDPVLPDIHLRSPAEQQEALNTLLQKPQAGTLVLSTSGLNGLVDALFAQTNGVRDVSVRADTLFLTLAGGDPRAACANAAVLVARYNVNLAAVAVTGAGVQARCAVQRRGAGALVNASLSQYPGAAQLDALALAPAALLTIDAAAPQPPDAQTVLKTIKADAAKQNIAIAAISLSDSEALVYYTNLKYFQEDDAVKRLVRVLMADAPPNIEKFRLVATQSGVPEAEFDLLRAPTERAVAQTGSYNLLADGNVLTDAPLQNPVLTAAERGTYPRFSWYLFPQFRQELFDPDNPFAVQLLAGLQTFTEIAPGLSLSAEGEASVYDNFNTARDSFSVLPHVRTDWTRYFTEGKNGIGQLELDYLTRLAPDVFALGRVGYIESMFGGVGGEVLWRPEGQRWAIGADLYHVKQRDFDRLLGFQPYQVTTGHVSLYYASPWYDLNFEVRAGQYLAGDRGLTFQLSRRFSTGVELGIFFTKTNVSSDQFGEGSFDKGFIIKIPLQWTLPVSSQGSLNTIIRPIQRDGGQALENDEPLYAYLQRNGTADVLPHAADYSGQ